MKSCSSVLLLILAIIGGLALGLLIGWVLWPVEWTDASPEQMRVEFQTDWMNMAIDSFSVNQNTELAAERYSYLGEDGPIILHAVVADPVWVNEGDALAYQQTVTGASAAGAPVPAATQETAVTRALKPPLLGYVLVVLFLALLAVVLLIILVFRLLRGDKGKTPVEAAAVVAVDEQSQPAPLEEAPIEGVVEPEVETESRSDLAALALAGAAGATLTPDQEAEEAPVEAAVAEEAVEEARIEETRLEAPAETVEDASAVSDEEGGISAGTFAAGAALAAAGVAAATGSETEEQAAEPVIEPGEAAAAGAAVTGIDWALEEESVDEPPLDAETSTEEVIAASADESGTWVAETTEEVPNDFYGKYNRKVIDIEGVGEAYAKRLADVGITTTHGLLQQCATTKGRQELADKTGISGKLILEWANHADMMRVSGIGPQWSDLLEMVGVNTVRELALRNPANLHQMLVDVNTEKKLVRQLPTPAQVEDWIEQAKDLPRILTY